MLRFEETTRRYSRGASEVFAVDHVNLAIDRGEFAVLRGPSGSGKSTLLLTAGAMLRPTEGRVVFEGRDIYASHQRHRAALRARRIGYIFQLFNLIPYLSVTENVLLSVGGPRSSPSEAAAMLDRLGLAQRLDHRPAELSVGERQRVAVARALLHKPDLILADEPVAGLDDESAAIVIECLREQHQRGATILLATHARSGEMGGTREIRIDRGTIPASSTTTAEPVR